MSPSRLLFAALLFACAACADGPAGPEPPRGWRALAGAPIAGPGSRHEDIFFLDDQRGWLVNVRGEVHGTTDGGVSWRRLNAGQGALFRAVGFASPSRGWIGNLNFFNSPAPGSALWETTDGGATWTNISDRIVGPDPAGICGLWVVDASTVYGVGRWNGPAVFVRSTDGGNTWDSQDLAPLATGLVDVVFFDRDHGLVIGGRGVGNPVPAQAASVVVILGTDDGGDSWNVRYETTAPGSWGWKFSFPTDSIGYAAVQGPTPGGIILKTNDGGLTWTEQLVDPAGSFSGIGFADSMIGWVGADGSSVYETRDGGATWALVPVGESINRFRMRPSGIGFAVGRTVYKYEP